MPSMIPVLIHDADIPSAVRAQLRAALDSPAMITKRRAAAALVGLFGLAVADAQALIGLDEEPARRAA